MENDQEKPTVSSPTCTALLCDDCGFEIGDDSPSDGWQIGDKTVCHTCCSADFGRIVDIVIGLNKEQSQLTH